MKATSRPTGEAASAKITQRIADLGDWRGETLARLRQLIHDEDPEIEEEWKWMGTPVWSHDGGVCTGESYKQVVKLTFFRGAILADPKQLFNSSLEGNARRAIDFREGETIDEVAFKRLIRAAVTANAEVIAQRGAKKAVAKKATAPVKTATKKTATKKASKKTVAKKTSKKKTAAKKVAKKASKKKAIR
jgi:hypothetical protein